MVKHTKSTADIAGALELGGLKHASEDFNRTLRSALGQKEEFLRVNGDWGLAEWYPGMGRGKKTKVEKQVKPSPKKPKAKEPAVHEAQSRETRRVRIIKIMKSDLDKA